MDINVFHDPRGMLTPFELDDFPFKVERVFIVKGAQNSVRGRHAHKKNEQILYCASGVAEVRTSRDGIHWKVRKLHAGLWDIHPAVEWLEMFFQAPDTVVVSFCSEKFDEKDYIDDFEKFKKVAGPYWKTKMMRDNIKREAARLRAEADAIEDDDQD